jgi:dihydroorotate dehydrogenase electron transfer subunit
MRHSRGTGVTVSPTPALERVSVIANERLAPGIGLLTLHAPRCAASVRPGQFVHIRIAADADTILRRPFSVHYVRGEHIEILYQVLGAGTLRLAEKQPGDTSMDVVGPLGHGWSIPEGAAHALMVSGGLGAAPLGMLAEELAKRGVAAVAAMGAPTAERLVARELFEGLARRVEVATDDGSAGTHGLVTALSERLLEGEHFDVVYTCGPEAMQRTVAAGRPSVGSAVVSPERLMACGIGARLSCVVTMGGQEARKLTGRSSTRRGDLDEARFPEAPGRSGWRRLRERRPGWWIWLEPQEPGHDGVGHVRLRGSPISSTSGALERL